MSSWSKPSCRLACKLPPVQQSTSKLGELSSSLPYGNSLECGMFARLPSLRQTPFSHLLEKFQQQAAPLNAHRKWFPPPNSTFELWWWSVNNSSSSCRVLQWSKARSWVDDEKAVLCNCYPICHGDFCAKFHRKFDFLSSHGNTLHQQTNFCTPRIHQHVGR